jgi:hypothetical protein
MSTPQRQQIRVLMRVFCEDWFCLTASDDPVIEALITTAYLATQPATGVHHHYA